MRYTVPHFIQGKLLVENSGQSQNIFNPSTGEIIGQTVFASSISLDRAIAAAKSAQPKWAALPAAKRARVLYRFRELLENERSHLAHIVSREHGKTLEDALGSIARGIELVEHHCGILSQLQGSYTANAAQGLDCYTLRQPLGICAGVSPFNFPVMVPLWLLIPAIAAGNSFILKPSEQNPSAPLRLLELLTEAGLPDGVANLVQGNKETVSYLLEHPDIHAVTAVASTPVAEHIYKTAIAHGKRSQTFGGAKNHALIMPDADFDEAAKAIVGAAYGSAGERCMAISVALVIDEDSKERLLKALIPLVKAIRVDAADVQGTDMGPLISQAHRERVIQAINKGLAEGARLEVDGRSFQQPRKPAGFYLGPSLFSEVSESMSLYQNEIFGPVLCLLQIADFDAAIALINRHQYGNGTAIFTNQGYYARSFAERVQVGMVGVNVPIPVPIASHPFGGWKRSSFGDCNMHGLESLQFYTRRKTVSSRWPAEPSKGSHFIMPSH